MGRWSVVLLLPTVAAAMVVWPSLPYSPTSPTNQTKPSSWADKNLGQWCRNFTQNVHRQCPQASAFHQFDCCGHHNTECCFAIQGWVILIATMTACSSLLTLIFYVLLKARLICLEGTYAPKTIYLGIKD
ncbi:unnamed protein product [Caenorhabditis auriculariae]|uniref:Uncharacterized protein n=1 Tax=Caenorhabditis auriculariae TaxID=2777116 RepID=A0A8S1HMQ4_9PELO|nr:unnamed protein product [Caenorhabditis auriculariae]